MSLIDLEPTKARAGQLFCSCGEVDNDAGTIDGGALLPAAVGFGLTIIVQSLLVAVLPIAGAEIATRPVLALLPYALTLVGALAASLPAALLCNAVGRTPAFALGASLGLAGAVLAAWSILDRQFAGLALGSFWLGIAQGFGFFYRHSAAFAARDKGRAIGLVIGAGGLAAIATPGLINVAQTEAGPLAPALALLFAGAVQVLILATSFFSSRKGLAAPRLPRTAPLSSHFIWTSLAGAFAWFGMALLMAKSPSLMEHCGIGVAGRAEIISWHCLAMYAPAAAIGLFWRNPPGDVLCAAGLALMAFSLLVLTRLTNFIDFGGVLIAAGLAWSLATSGATLQLHASHALSRPLLALHDGMLFAGAIAGVITAAFVH